MLLEVNPKTSILEALNPLVTAHNTFGDYNVMTHVVLELSADVVHNMVDGVAGEHSSKSEDVIKWIAIGVVSGKIEEEKKLFA